MWNPNPEKVILICLRNRGRDFESVWAEDLGPAPGRRLGARRVQLANVPIFHPKPTYGDIVIVEPRAPGRILTWDAKGQEHVRLEQDGGCHSVFLEYAVETGHDVHRAYRALSSAASLSGFLVEGCYGPDAHRPGLVSMAVPYAVTPDDVLQRLRAARLPVALTLLPQ